MIPSQFKQFVYQYSYLPEIVLFLGKNLEGKLNKLKNFNPIDN